MDSVVDIKRATRLNLHSVGTNDAAIRSSVPHGRRGKEGGAHSEIEGQLHIFFLDICKEAGLLIRGELVGESGGRDGGSIGPKATQRQKEIHNYRCRMEHVDVLLSAK